jgi:hypothetical protein
MSIEELKNVFDVGAVILLFLTFAFGAGAYYTGSIINGRQASQIRKFDSDLVAAKTDLEKQQQSTAEAQKEAAEAQLALKKYIDEVANKQRPRAMPDEPTLKILKAAPPKKAIIEYLDGASDTYLFATGLSIVLARAGWHVMLPLRPLSTLVGAAGGGTAQGEVIVTMRRVQDLQLPSTAEGALWNALLAAQVPVGGAQDETLADDTIKITVGPKF